MIRDLKWKLHALFIVMLLMFPVFPEHRGVILSIYILSAVTIARLILPHLVGSTVRNRRLYMLELIWGIILVALGLVVIDCNSSAPTSVWFRVLHHPGSILYGLLVVYFVCVGFILWPTSLVESLYTRLGSFIRRRMKRRLARQPRMFEYSWLRHPWDDPQPMKIVATNRGAAVREALRRLETLFANRSTVLPLLFRRRTPR